MSHMHEERVIHRDLAARNVLVDEHFHVRVTDFGFARQLGGPTDAGETKSIIGPVRWMSPENLRRVYSSSSDVWSFGVVLWELVMGGAEPWHGLALGDVCARVAQRETLEQFLPADADAALKNMMRACWRYNAADRPSMALLHARLQRYHDILKAEETHTAARRQSEYHKFRSEAMPRAEQVVMPEEEATAVHTSATAHAPHPSELKQAGKLPPLHEAPELLRDMLAQLYAKDEGTQMAGLLKLTQALEHDKLLVPLFAIGKAHEHLSAVLAWTVSPRSNANAALVHRAIRCVVLAAGSEDTARYFVADGVVESAMKAFAQHKRLSAVAIFDACCLLYNFTVPPTSANRASLAGEVVARGGVPHALNVIAAGAEACRAAAKGAGAGAGAGASGPELSSTRLLLLGGRALANLCTLPQGRSELVAAPVSGCAHALLELLRATSRDCRDAGAAVAAVLLSDASHRRAVLGMFDVMQELRRGAISNDASTTAVRLRQLVPKPPTWAPLPTSTSAATLAAIGQPDLKTALQEMLSPGTGTALHGLSRLDNIIREAVRRHGGAAGGHGGGAGGGAGAGAGVGAASRSSPSVSAAISELLFAYNGLVLSHLLHCIHRFLYAPQSAMLDKAIGILLRAVEHAHEGMVRGLAEAAVARVIVDVVAAHPVSQQCIVCLGVGFVKLPPPPHPPCPSCCTPPSQDTLQPATRAVTVLSTMARHPSLHATMLPTQAVVSHAVATLAAVARGTAADTRSTAGDSASSFGSDSGSGSAGLLTLDPAVRLLEAIAAFLAAVTGSSSVVQQRFLDAPALPELWQLLANNVSTRAQTMKLLAQWANGNRLLCGEYALSVRGGLGSDTHTFTHIARVTALSTRWTHCHTASHAHHCYGVRRRRHCIYNSEPAIVASLGGSC